jgi:hypothetical protein
MALNSDLYDTRPSGLSNTIVGIFAATKDAREAIKHLHKGKFTQTWLGITKPADSTGEPLVEDANSFSRFVSADRMSLHKALLERGVSESQAQQIEEDIAPGCAVLTVYGEDNPARVSEILSANKGHVIDAGAELPTAVSIAGQRPRTGVTSDERKENERQMDRESRPDGEARHDRDHRESLGDDEYAYDEAEFVEWRPRVGV